MGSGLLLLLMLTGCGLDTVNGPSPSTALNHTPGSPAEIAPLMPCFKDAFQAELFGFPVCP